MRILKESRKNGFVRLKTEFLDDLWQLSKLIKPGDKITARTERKIDVGGDRAKQVRKQLVLSGEVVSATLEHDILRVQTTITSGPDDLVSHGDHHSFQITVHDEFDLEKEFDSIEYKKLKEATKQQPLNILLVTFDREEAWFAHLTRRGYDTITAVSGDVAKKRAGGGEENFWKTLAEMITQQDNRNQYQKIIIASPAFWTDYLQNTLSKQLQQKVVTATCSAVGESALSELSKRPELTNVLEEDKTSKEEQLITQLLEAIHHEKACYGLEDVKEKVLLGQVKTLLVSHELIMQARQEDFYDELEELLTQAEQMQADVHLFEHVTDQLDSLGKIAGILRW